jgi:hypothetical protein
MKLSGWDGMNRQSMQFILIEPITRRPGFLFQEAPEGLACGMILKLLVPTLNSIFSPISSIFNRWEVN